MKYVASITDLDALPVIVTLNEVLGVLRIGESTARRDLQAGTFRPAPWAKNPYRFRKADLIAELERSRCQPTRPRGRPAKASLKALAVKASAVLAVLAFG